LVLIEDDEEKRRGIRGPVVRRVWTLAEVSQLTIAQLMQDLARLRVPEVVNLDRLVRTEGEQGGPGQLWYERDGLQARDETVPAEQGHEPRQARGRQRGVGHALRVVPERGKVGETAAVHLAQLVPIRLQARCRSEPLLQIDRSLRGVGALRNHRAARRGHPNADRGGPGSPWRQAHPEGQGLVGEVRLRRAYVGLAAEVASPVAEGDPVRAVPPIERALLLEFVLDLKQIREVRVEEQRDLQVHRGDTVVLQLEVLVEPIDDLAA